MITSNTETRSANNRPTRAELEAERAELDALDVSLMSDAEKNRHIMAKMQNYLDLNQLRD